MYTRSDRTPCPELLPLSRPVLDLSWQVAPRTASRAKLGRSEYVRTARTDIRIEIPRKTPHLICPPVPTPIGWGRGQVGGRYGSRKAGQADMKRSGRADLEKPWDELTDEQKDRAYGWAREVMELGHRTERLNRELDQALRRQEVEQMEKASAELYRALGHPEGYQYRGGPVGWDGVGA